MYGQAAFGKMVAFVELVTKDDLKNKFDKVHVVTAPRVEALKQFALAVETDRVKAVNEIASELGEAGNGLKNVFEF